MPPPNSSSQADDKSRNDNFKVVEIVRDPDGVIAVITERVRDGRVSFSIAREIDKKGLTERTSYLARRHLPAVRRLLDDLTDRLELAEDQARAKRR